MPHQCTTCGQVFADGSKEMLSGCPDCGGNAFQFHPKGTDIPDEPPDADPPEPDQEAGGTVGRAASTVRNLVGGDDATPDAGHDTGEAASSGDGTASSRATDTTSRAPDTSATGGASGPADATTSTSTSGSTPRENAPWPDDRDGDEGGDIIVADETEFTEDEAQSSARGGFASPDELPETGDAAADDAGALDAAVDDATDTPDGPVAATEAGDGLPAGEMPAADGRVASEPADDQPDLAELREQLNDQFESIKIVEPGEYELNLMELYDREEYIIALQENGRYVIQVPENWLGDEPGAE
jgi:predicted  nucleic acid-binding Zn-ribbon protein